MPSSPGLPDLSLATLQKSVSETPLLTLDFYSFGIVLRKVMPTGLTEYPVSPADVATVLSAQVAFSTGILDPNTICVSSEGAQRTVVAYRPPQKTTIWLDGLEDPIRVPLPGLLMSRTTTAGTSPSYRVYAVAERPTSRNAQLYRAPLPNIYDDGKICWGTVATPSREALAGAGLVEDWRQLLGTRFGNHSVHGKCRSYEYDIRQFYLALDKRQARVYPKKELVAARGSLGILIEAAS